MPLRDPYKTPACMRKQVIVKLGEPTRNTSRLWNIHLLNEFKKVKLFFLNCLE
jgi:hypothetical protein